MKFHLPKKLFMAVLAAMASSAYAVGPMYAQVIQMVDEGKTTDSTMLLKFSNNNGLWPDSSNDAPQVWVKDGLGTATVTSDVTMYNPLVVREGTMCITGATVKNYNTLSNGVSNLSVGGKDAHLILDAATYKQDLDYNQNYTSAIAIGTGDGAGTVTLKNGSVLHTDHYIFAGQRSTSYNGQPAYVVQTTKSWDDDSLYESQHPEGTSLRSEINVESGSLLSAGTCLQFANVDVNIKGVGSVMKDLNRDTSPAGAANSYFGRTDNSVTNVNVSEGGAVNLQQNLMTGLGADSESNISVDGEASAFNVTGGAYLGYGGYDSDAQAYFSNGSSTSLKLTNGASSTMGTLVAGYADKVTVSIDATSSLSAGSIWVYENAEITSAGSISTDDLTVYGAKLDLSGPTSSISAGSVYLAEGSTLALDVTNRTTAPVTISSTSFTMVAGTAVEIAFTESFMTTITGDSANLNMLVVSGANEDSSVESTISYSGVDTMFWNVADLSWATEEGNMYITGTLTRNTEIIIDEEIEVSQNITDTPGEKAVSVKVTADATLSGNNSYSGGTSVTESTLTLGSADALGEGSIVTSGTSAITVAEGITANLKGTITNTGDLTLDGQMDASALTKDAVDETHLNTAGETGNDGFKRDAGSSITLVNNSGSITTGSSWGVTHSGTTYTLDTTTGIAYAHGETHYGTYFINSADHSVAVSAIQAASSNATTKVEMKAGSLTADAGDIEVATTGGTLTTSSGKVSGSIADTSIAAQGGEIVANITGSSKVDVTADTTLSGTNSYTGGTSVTESTLTLGSADALGEGSIVTSGTSAITVAEGITANLKSTITNTGDLTLDGQMDASALTKDAVDETHLNTAGETGNDGFKRDAGSSITLVNNSGSLSTGSAWGVTHSGTTYTLDTTTGIAYAHGETHYGTYFINSADHSVAVSAIQAASSNATTLVEMKAGSLTADAGDIEVAATGGTLTTSSGKVSGSIADTTVEAQGGDIAADITGSSKVDVTADTTLSGTNSYTGGTSVTESTLTLGSADALGEGSIVTSGTSAITVAEGITANLKSTITNTGDLTLDGQMDASVLTKDTVDETYLNTAGETGHDGFKRDAGSSITLVNNSGSLSTGSAWSVTHSGITYTLDTTTGIAYAHGETHYGTYFINSADHSVALSAIQAASGDATTKVEMKTGSLTADSDVNLKAAGGALTVDASATVTGSMLNTNISLVNGEIDGEIKGGMLTTTSGKVTGSMADVYVAAQGGEIAAGISGDSTVNVSGDTTLSGANSYTGDTSVTDATLTLGSTDALGAGDITTGGASAITVAEGITANLKTSITNTGDLTLDGKMDASALAKVAVEETHLNTAGETGHDGFKRDAGSSITLVNNSGSITTGSSWGVTHSGTTYTLDTTTGIAYAHGTTHYGTYFINSADHNVAVSAIQAASSNATTKVEMKTGSLSADAGDIEVATTGGTLTTTSGKVSGSIADTTVSAQGGEITADISGKSTVAVTGNTTLSGTNSYTGGTVIDGAELTVTKDNGLGSGEVTMKNHAVLDLSGAAISNRIVVYGCTLKGGHSYSGNLEVDGGELTLTDPTCADTVNVTNGGIITGATLDANKVTVTTDSPDKVSKIESDLTINNNGTLTLEGGETLDVKGSLTLGSGSKLVIKGDGKLNVTGQVTIESGANIVTSGEHEVGEELIVSDKPIDVADDVVLTLGDKEIILHKDDTALIIVNHFKPELAKTYTVSNWGAITASRAVVNAVRGQRTNTGCIANGRGTAWAAVLGGMHDISSSEIKLEGAAVGADMKVGRRSNLGVAFSYVEGDVSPSGLSKVDQEGTYMALYGEHGLKKLSSTSCLSLDWVLAYGETESEQGARDWEQKSVQFNTRLNWNKQLTSRLSMNVFGGLEYYANESDTVDGVKTGSLQNLRGEIGVGARYVAWGTPATKIAAGCEKLVFHGELRYMNDMVRSNPVIEMNNARGGADNPGRYGMGVEAGATYRFNGRWSASANYGFNTMEDSREHRVNVGASCTF